LFAQILCKKCPVVLAASVVTAVVPEIQLWKLQGLANKTQHRDELGAPKRIIVKNVKRLKMFEVCSW